MMTRLGLILVLAALVVVGTPAFGQDDDTADLAKDSQNPVANMVSLPFQANWNFNAGPEERTQFIMNIQPVIPINLGRVNMINRIILPVTSQPYPFGEREFGLGDTSIASFFSPAEPGKIIWGIGPTLIVPTATDEVLGSEKWSAGPSAVILTMPGSWVIGALVSNVWSFAGDDDRADVNFFSAQYFVNYNMPRGWYLTSSPIITANWEADSDDRWTVPFGGGFGRVFRIGKQPVNWNIAAYYNVEKPDNGPDWQLRTQFTFLFPMGKKK